MLETVSIYCERTSSGFWAEPFNALSNIAFILVALTSVISAQRRHKLQWPIVVAAALVVTIGIGSFLFHTFANQITQLMDVIPIWTFVIYIIILMLHEFIHLSWIRAIGSILILSSIIAASVFVFNHVGANTLFPTVPPDTLNGSLQYLPAIGALYSFAGFLLWRHHPARWWIAGAAGTFTVSLGLRTIDFIACPRIPIGTHFGWHILNAITIWCLLESVIRHGTRDNRQMPQKPASQTHVVKYIINRLNPFTHFDVFGNATVYDRIYYVTGFITNMFTNFWSLLGCLYMFEEIGMDRPLLAFMKLDNASVHGIIVDTSLSVIAVYTTSYLTERVAKMSEYLSGGSWFPYSRPPHPNEYMTIYNLYTDVFAAQQDSPSYEMLETLMSNNLLHAFIVFKQRIKSGDQSICGFFVIQYLSHDGLNAILGGTKDGRHFDRLHLTTDGATASAIYLGALGGKGRMNQGFVVSQLYAHASPHYATQAGGCSLTN
jgi:Ceramidase